MELGLVLKSPLVTTRWHHYTVTALSHDDLLVSNNHKRHVSLLSSVCLRFKMFSSRLGVSTPTHCSFLLSYNQVYNLYTVLNFSGLSQARFINFNPKGTLWFLHCLMFIMFIALRLLNLSSRVGCLSPRSLCIV